MTHTLKKHGLLLIAAVLLAALAFTGAASADTSVSDWSGLKTAVTEWTGPGTLTVVVTSDITCTETGPDYAGIPVTGSVIIKAGTGQDEFTIDADQKGRLFNVASTGSLTIVGNGNTKLTLTGGLLTGDNAKGGAIFVDGGTLVLGSGARITDCHLLTAGKPNFGGAVYVQEHGVFTMSGDSSISGCSVQGSGYMLGQGGGAYVLEGTFTMSDSSSISHCDAITTNNMAYTGYGGGVYLTKSVFTMNGASTISYCNATFPAREFLASGGGVFGEYVDVIMNDQSSITNCFAHGNGGGIFLICGRVIMNDYSEIADCSADYSGGGGIEISIGEEISEITSEHDIAVFEMHGHSSITNCHSKDSSGGGVYISAYDYSDPKDYVFRSAMYDDSKISGCRVYNDRIGGGMYLLNVHFTMHGRSSITNCCSIDDDGGGIYFNYDEDVSYLPKLTMCDQSSITYCEGYCGGGVYIYDGILEMDDTSIISNCIAESGGGVYVDHSGSLTMHGKSSIVDCKADGDADWWEGGGVYIRKGSVAMDDYSTIARCTAKLGGGGVYLTTYGANNEFTMSGHSSISACEIGADSNGGGVYVPDGGVTFDISGAATVIGNTKSDGSTADNVYLAGTTQLTLANIFTGRVGISNPTSGQFGVAQSGASGAENFALDGSSNSLQVGKVSSGTLVWTNGNAVTFDPNYQGGTTWIKTAENGGLIQEPETPKRSGYAFDGWYTESTCSTPWNFATDTVTEDRTLYAAWIAPPVNITLNPRGGNGIITTYTAPMGEKSAIPNPGFTRTGFTQNGWSDDPEDTAVKYLMDDTISPSADMTLYAVWGQGGTTNVTLYNEPTFMFFVPSDVILSNEAGGLVGTNVSIVPGQVKDAGKDIIMRVNTTAEKQYPSQSMFSTFSLAKFGSEDKALYSLYVYADKDAFYEKVATKQVTGSQHTTGGYTDANNIVIGSRGAAESPAVSALLGFKTDKLPSVAGVYNGKLTFTVGVESPVPV